MYVYTVRVYMYACMYIYIYMLYNTIYIYTYLLKKLINIKKDKIN